MTISLFWFILGIVCISIVGLLLIAIIVIVLWIIIASASIERERIDEFENNKVTNDN